jgi:Tfp pilus assembly protein PilV
MNLLEAVVALVILGLTATGFLDLFARGSSGAAQAEQWERTVAAAESAMEAVTLGDALQAQQAVAGADPRYAAQVDVRPFAGDVVRVTVTVTSPNGPAFSVQRLVRQPARLPGTRP